MGIQTSTNPSGYATSCVHCQVVNSGGGIHSRLRARAKVSVLSTETADRNVYNLRISDLQFCTRNRQRTIRFSRAGMHDILIDIDFTVCGRYCEALDLVYQVCHR